MAEHGAASFTGDFVVGSFVLPTVVKPESLRSSPSAAAAAVVPNEGWGRGSNFLRHAPDQMAHRQALHQD